MSTADQPGARLDGWRTLDQPRDEDDPEVAELLQVRADAAQKVKEARAAKEADGSHPRELGIQEEGLDRSLVESKSTAEVIGVCVSGGGIRSASFALGVLTQLDWGAKLSDVHESNEDMAETVPVTREHSVLGNARYLAAVSGGAWAATAWTLRRALAVTPDGRPNESPDNAARATIDWLSDADPKPGFGFQRQNYLMNGRGGILGSLCWMLLCMLVNLVLIGSLITLVGWTAGWLQTQCGVSEDALGVGTCPDHYVSLRGWIRWVFDGFGLVAVGLLLAWLCVPAKLRWARRRGLQALGGAAVVYLYMVMLPKVFAFIQHNPHWLQGIFSAITTSAVLAVFAGVWKVIGGPVMHEVDGPLARIAPRLMGVVMAGGWLLTGLIIMYAATQEPRWTYAVPSAAIVLIFLIVVLCTPNRPTLHDIFSKRLQRSFPPAAPPGAASEHRTTWEALKGLSRPGLDTGVPELVLCCSSQRHGIAPGGLRADVFTISPSWVRQGRRSAQTTHYVDALKSVEFGEFGDLGRPAGWLAITGAAFSSAMGRTSLGTTNAVLAAANIDLGNWLPNLAWLQAKRGPGPKLAQPKPALRRPGFTHLFDEILGRYSPNFRYSFITDGGHWDNLGLVELLRRNCDRIYCIDASADHPGTFTTLREAMTLASLELGISWDPAALDDALEPLTATDTSPPLRSVATFEVPRAPMYDDDSGDEAAPVIVHYAKLQASLDMSLEVKRYAAADPKFPVYSTMKQFLSPEQFNRLVTIGKDTGVRLAAAASEPFAFRLAPATAISRSARHLDDIQKISDPPGTNRIGDAGRVTPG
jgi:hypothetical protein